MIKMKPEREDRLIITVQTDIEEYNSKLDRFNPLTYPLVLKKDKINGNGWYTLTYGERLIWYGSLEEINISVKTLLKMQEIQNKMEIEA